MSQDSQKNLIIQQLQLHVATQLKISITQLKISILMSHARKSILAIFYLHIFTQTNKMPLKQKYPGIILTKIIVLVNHSFIYHS